MSYAARATPLLALILLTGYAQLSTATAAIFKCRSADGYWSYADRPEPSCRGRWTILKPLPAARRARPAASIRATRPPSPMAHRTAERRLRRWQATLHALRATRVPRDQTLARWRAQALHIVVADIARLRGRLGPQDGRRSP